MRLRDAAGTPPVYMAANGPQNLAFAGGHADGVIVLTGRSVAALRRSLDLVHRGAAAAGRAPEGLEVVVSAFCRSPTTSTRDARLLKPICAAIAQTGGGGVLAMGGHRRRRSVEDPEVYPDLVHAEDWETAVEVSGTWISDDDALFSPGVLVVRDRRGDRGRTWRPVEEAGATQVLLQHVASYDLPSDLMAAVGAARRPLM